MRLKPLLLLCLVLAGCQGHEKRDALAIKEVFRQRAELRAIQQSYAKKAPSSVNQDAVYLSKLKGIETEKCPPDFRSAWLAYVLAVNDERTLSHFIRSFSSPGALFSTHDESNKAWENVQVVAIKYGVKAP